MVERADLEIDGLQAAKGTLDTGEVLVGADDPIGCQGVVFEAGADDIKPVEPRLGRDAVGDCGRR